MSIIDLLNLPNIDTNLIATKCDLVDDKKLITPKDDIFVSIVLTESVASNLNLKIKHLQDPPEKTHKKSLLLLPRLDTKSDGYPGTTSKLLDEFNVDIAFFRSVHMDESSTSVEGQDDLSEEETDDGPSVTNSDTYNYYLEPFVTRIGSLQAVRSVAHEGNLYIEAGAVYIYTYNSQLPTFSSEWEDMCRICFGSASSEHLIRPCRCKGTVALTHLSCLERWLKESGRNHCELCQEIFEITRVPKYRILPSVFVWMFKSSRHRRLLLGDLLAFGLYTPVVLTSTHILMLIFESAAQSSFRTYNPGATIVCFCSILGMAVIDFTYTSWLLMHFQKHLIAWRSWYRENCCLTLVLPPRKLRRCITETENNTESG